MNKSLVPAAVAAATAAMLALTSPAEAGGGRYFGNSGHAGGPHWNGGHASGPHWNGSHGGQRHWHGGHWHSSWGWYGWGWPAAAFGASVALAATWPYWTGGYYYYDAPATYIYPPAVVYRSSAPVGEIVAPAAAASPASWDFRLFCPATNAYYPDVLDCAPYFVKVNPDANGSKSAPDAQRKSAPPAPPVFPQSAPAPAPSSSVPGAYVPARLQTVSYAPPARVIPAPRKLGPGIALGAPAQPVLVQVAQVQE